MTLPTNRRLSTTMLTGPRWMRAQAVRVRSANGRLAKPIATFLIGALVAVPIGATSDAGGIRAAARHRQPALDSLVNPAFAGGVDRRGATHFMATDSQSTVGPVDIRQYPIGEIPPQQAVYGSVLAFQLRSSAGGAVTFQGALDPGYPTPVGSVGVDSNSGRFTYRPDPTDKFEFRITFTSLVAGTVKEAQSVLIRPMPPLSPETDLVNGSVTTPDPRGTDYLLFTQSHNSAPELFNGSQRVTWNVEVSGKHVIFDSGTPLYGSLYTRLHNRPDVKNLSIYGETVTIRSPLRLPGTNVSIYARYLRFEDAAGQGSINTTPLDFLVAADQFQDGAAGQKAGDVTLHIQNFLPPPGSTVRFIAGGGAGQNAGQGRPGIPKPDLFVDGGARTMRWGPGVGRVVLDFPFKKQNWGWVIQSNGQPLPQNAPYPTVIYVQSDPCGEYRLGARVWPADGDDAVPPGKPGTGGDGGKVASSRANVSGYVQLPGGPGGKPGAAQSGAPPQKPVYSAWLRTIDGTRCAADYFNFQIIDVHTSVAGENAVAVAAASPQGSNGTFQDLPDAESLSWLHPNLLRMVMAHARDTYRAGDLQSTKTVLDGYAELLHQFGAFPPAFAPDFRQMRDEIQLLTHRIGNNLDYFGHTAGWAPLLSLEATMSAFNNEVDAAIPVLFLSQWLQAQGQANLKDTAALQEAMKRLSQEAHSSAASVNDALAGIPGLRQEALEISAELENVQIALEKREAALIEQARTDLAARQKLPGWKKALRTIGAVAKTIPVYQPALGLIGEGLTLVTNLDTSQPLQSLKNVPDLSDLFKGETWAKSEEDYNKVLKSIDLFSFKDAAGAARELGEIYQKHSELIKQTLDMFQTSQITDEDLRRQFDQVSAADSVFNDLKQQVASLTTRKQVFGQAVSNTLEQIAAGQTTVTKDLLSVASMYSNLNSTAAQFDHGMMGYIKDMDGRARERLLRYHYYMAKAYEYRLLRPFPGDLNIDRVVDKIIELLHEQGYSGVTNVAALAAVKAVYVDSVREIVSSALIEYAVDPSDRQRTDYFWLTAAQLQQLNQSGRVSIDLATLIPAGPGEENRHLADLRVSTMAVGASGPVGPSARVRLQMVHGGQSTITRKGHTFRFHFGRKPDDQPFSWGASYTMPGGPLSHETLSTSGLSLLRSLLKMPEPIDALILFARPAADSVITLSKRDDPLSLKTTVTSLQLGATIEFSQGEPSMKRINVRSSQVGAPYTAIGQMDVSGRRDGIGDFSRTYLVGQRVTLVAEPRYGKLRFNRWVDSLGNTLGTAPSLTLTIVSDLDIRAVYLLPQTHSDYDGDGLTDLVLQHPGGAVAVWLLNGTKFKEARSIYDGASNGAIVASGDFDGDGQVDVVWQFPDGQVAVWLLNGTTFKEWGWVMTAATDWKVVGSGDFNADGKPDLVWQRPGGGVSVWLLNGISMIENRAVFDGATQAKIVGVDDIDGDNQIDLVWQHPNGAVSVSIMNGTRPLGERTINDASTTWKVVGTGDFNWDGKADMAYQLPGGAVVVVLMDGISLVEWRALYEGATDWRATTR